MNKKMPIKKADKERLAQIPLHILTKEEKKTIEGRDHETFILPRLYEGWYVCDVYTYYKPYAWSSKIGITFLGRAFCNLAESRYGLLQAGEGWSSKSISQLGWYGDPQYFKEEDRVFDKSYFGEDESLEGWLYRLKVEAYKVRNAAKAQKRDEDMKMAKPLTATQEKFLRSGVYKGKNFAYFNRKMGKCRCTACGKSIPIEGVKQRQKIRCPECGELIEGRSKVATQSFTGVIIEPEKNGETIFRYFDCTRSFVKGQDEGTLDWDSFYVEKGRSIDYAKDMFAKNESITRDYTRDVWLEGEYQWKPVHELKVGGGHFAGANCKLYGETRYFRGNLYLLRKTKFRYLPTKALNRMLDLFEKHGTLSMFDGQSVMELAVDTGSHGHGGEPYRAAEYEYMLKLGWFKVIDFQYGYSYPKLKVDHKKASFYEMLGLTREQFNALGENPDPKVVRILQEMNESGNMYSSVLSGAKDASGKLNEKVVLGMHEANRNNYIAPISCEEARELAGVKIYSEVYMFLRMFMTHHKVMKYVKQGNDPQIWKDYIEDEFRLGYKKTEIEFFPKDLQKAHDDAVNMVHLEEDKQRDKKLALVGQALEERYSYTGNGFTIVVPKSSKDFKTEAAHMHNCVAKNYMDPMANGQTAILFVREEKHKEKSLCTMEIKGGKVVQLYAAGNEKAPKAVADTIIDFCKEKKLRYAA